MNKKPPVAAAHFSTGLILLFALSIFTPTAVAAQDPAPETDRGSIMSEPDEQDSGEADEPEPNEPAEEGEDEIVNDDPPAPNTDPDSDSDEGQPLERKKDDDYEEAFADETGEDAAPIEEPDHEDAEEPPALVEDEIDEAAPAPRAEPSRAARVRLARGFAFRIDGGQALWSLDAAHIGEQLGAELRDEVQPEMVDKTPNAPALTFHAGYNVLGHATFGLELSGTGWNLFDPGRGGGGLAAGTIAWHPAELVAELVPTSILRQRTWDVSLFAGAGWGAVGKDRALRGPHFVLGARAEIYLADWFSLGATVRRFGLLFDEYVVHWDNDEFVELDDGSGGSLFIPSLTITMRVPTGG